MCIQSSFLIRWQDPFDHFYYVKPVISRQMSVRRRPTAFEVSFPDEPPIGESARAAAGKRKLEGVGSALEEVGEGDIRVSLSSSFVKEKEGTS